MIKKLPAIHFRGYKLISTEGKGTGIIYSDWLLEVPDLHVR